MSEDRARLRSLHGASTALWAGDGVRVEDGRWVAFSGAPAVDYNVALCHGGGGGAVRATLEEVAALGVPALIMLGAQALGDVQPLVDAGWVCVGAVPFMALPLEGGEAPQRPDPQPRRLQPAELASAQALAEAVFGLSPQLAAISLPPTAFTTPGRSIWGLHTSEGELTSCLAAVLVEDALIIWSMATAPSHRRQGQGTHLLQAVLGDAAQSGAKTALLQSSPEGEPFYRAIGYRDLEHWQLWSRPRWVLAR
jgi:GNAT superfamily N-acetyltransferase